MTQTLTPADLEKRKSAEQRAEDIAYTINHSLACTATDFINPIVNTFTEGRIKAIGGCGHDHSKDGGHCHHVPAPTADTWWGRVKQSSKNSFSRERLMQWTKGEFIGDFGAVPLTIFVQRAFPNFMNGTRKLIEPLMGGIFRYGVERDSKRWARRHDVDTSSAAYRQHVDEVYEHEMSHLPQAVVWTGFALALNVGYQKYKDATRPLAGLLAACMSGMAVTAGLVVAARAIAPHKVREFDKATSEHVMLPATRVVGKLFGVDDAAVDRMAAEQERLHEGWQARIEAQEQDKTKTATRA